MSDSDEDYVAPEEITQPLTGTFEVVQETYQPPTASHETVQASEPPRASIELTDNRIIVTNDVQQESQDSSNE